MDLDSRRQARFFLQWTGPIAISGRDWLHQKVRQPESPKTQLGTMGRLVMGLCDHYLIDRHSSSVSSQ